MNRFDAKSKFSAYLKRYNISFIEDFDNGAARIAMIYKGYNNCPDKMLESCIWFYENEMELRVYYVENTCSWCKKSNYISTVMRLFNFVNAQVWPRTADYLNDALYKPHHLHTPRLYMTEDGLYDISLTSVIAYDFYAFAPLETEDYITVCCPELLNKLAPAVFGVLLGQLDVEQAIDFVKVHVVDDTEEGLYSRKKTLKSS